VAVVGREACGMLRGRGVTAGVERGRLSEGTCVFVCGGVGAG
jgi:hypothetical protein